MQKRTTSLRLISVRRYPRGGYEIDPQKCVPGIRFSVYISRIAGTILTNALANRYGAVKSAYELILPGRIPILNFATHVAAKFRTTNATRVYEDSPFSDSSFFCRLGSFGSDIDRDGFSYLGFFFFLGTTFCTLCMQMRVRTRLRGSHRGPIW